MRYYGELVGSATTNLQGIDIDALRQGSQLIDEQFDYLTTPVAGKEILKALKGIKDSTTLGVDGYGVKLFMATWNIRKHYLIAVIKALFEK